MRKTMRSILALGTVIPSALFAQTQTEPVAPAPEQQAVQPSEDELELETIVVTGDRPGFGPELVQVGTFRNARIIDVPLTVNVVPQELLRSQAVTGIFDALRNTAGVTRSQLSGTTYDNIAIRGILVENRTSYRLNGSMPVINLVDLPLENKDRVEVLKGVGALYYGFAPPSGIVNLVTKRPNRDVTAFTASVNDNGGVNATADISRRLTDSFGVRVNGGAGIVENGIRRFDGDRFVGALAADWDISEAIGVKFDVEHVSKDVTEPPALQLLPAAQGFVPDIPDPDLNFGGNNLRYDAYATNYLGRVDLRISRTFALTVEGGQALTVRDRDFSQLENYGGPTGNGTLRLFRTRDQRFRNRNARAELAGVFETGPLVHNLIVGASSNWRFQNGRNTPTITVPQNFFNPRNVRLPEPTVFTLSPLDITDRGAYIVNRSKLGPVELLAGVRYSDYKSVAVSPTGVETRFELNKWTPSYGIIFKPAKDLSVYATYLEGLEEGGTAPINSAIPGDVLPPAVSKQYEAGVKGEVLSNVIFQLAAFQIERPLAFVDPADRVFKFAGENRYRGVEASFTGEVTRRLSVYLSGQYLDAEATSAVNPLLLGKRPENTPEWTANAYVEYRPEAIPGFAVGGGALYVGNRAVNSFNDAFVEGFTLFQASVRYTFENIGEGLTLQLNAENLTNERYWNTASNGLLGIGRPRQVKLTARLGL